MLDSLDTKILATQIHGPPQTLAPRSDLGNRDAFVSATAIKIDHFEKAIARLERDMDVTRVLIADLTELVEQNHRLNTFENSEKRMKEARLDEALRCWKDLKSRVDRMDGGVTPSRDPLRTFESVNKRIAGLARDTQQQAQGLTQAYRLTILTAFALIAVVVTLTLGL